MPSYKLIPTETDQYDPDDLRDGIEAEDGTTSNRDPRCGTIPSTFDGSDGSDLYWVEFGWERTYTRSTWNGTETYIDLERYPVLFLQNGYIAHHKARSEVTTAIRAILQDILDAQISFDHVEFDPDDLFAVIDDADSVQRIDLAPTDRAAPEYLSASDRGDLRETTFMEDYNVEPFERVKIIVPSRKIDVNVGFDQSGTVILHGHDMPLRTQTQTLRYLCDELIDQYIDQNSVQGNLQRFQ